MAARRKCSSDDQGSNPCSAILSMARKEEYDEAQGSVGS